MQTTIEQDGEDLVVVIPQEIMDLAEIRIGDQVDVTLENGVIVIERHEGGNCEKRMLCKTAGRTRSKRPDKTHPLRYPSPFKFQICKDITQ